MNELRDRIYELVIRQTKKTATESRFFLPLPLALTVSDLSLTFNIEKNLGSTPNTCDLVIRNLAPASRVEVERDGTQIQFSAGYDKVPRLLFFGDVTYAHSKKSGTEWITEIQVGEGARAHRYARANRSFKGGTTAITVIREAAKSLGLKLPEAVEDDADLRAQFANGYALNGRAAAEMTRILASLGYGWSTQDGRLQILRDGDSTGDANRVINVDNGMLGSPEIGKPEKKGGPPKRSVKTLLYPEVNPGMRVPIESRDLEGIFKIEKLKHVGDTDADEWTTEIEVTSTVAKRGPGPVSATRTAKKV